MTSSADLRIVFRAAAGSRRGFGHLVRCLSLARAIGVRPLIALRGNAHASDVALALGADLLASPSPETLRALAPDVVVIDDPSASHARRWMLAARRAGALVVTIDDRARATGHEVRASKSVVITLGSGAHAQTADAVAAAIAAADAHADVRIVGGTGAAPRPSPPRVRVAADAAVKPLNTRRRYAALAHCSTAFVDGRGAWRAAAVGFLA